MPNSNGEKTPLESKKFLGFLLAEAGFFALMGLMTWLHELGSLSVSVAFIALAVIAGFIAVGYILGQSYVDKFVRVAQITIGQARGTGTIRTSE